MENRNHAGYLDCLFDEKLREQSIEKIKSALIPKAHLYNGIIVTGVSGMGLGFVLARELKKKIVILRKGESCHSSWHIENLDDKDKLVFLDDFISSGKTLNTVYSNINEAWPTAEGYLMQAKIVGAIFYDPFSFHWGNASVKRLIENNTIKNYDII